MNEKTNIKKIKGILSDIDGTLYFKGEPINGAVETISKLRKKGLKFLFFTNTDSKVPLTILNILNDYGFNIKFEEIFTPIIALKNFLSENPLKKSFLVATSEVEKEFRDFPIVSGSEIPDFVIISDFHDNWDVTRLNQAFNYVLKGAKLLGTQGNKYYLDRSGEPVIDTGSFVQMIAYAANVDPIIFGKPSTEYFFHALKRINLNSDEVIVVGDDPESDIQGAINAGIHNILVRSGKGKFFESEKSEIKPSMIIDSFKSLLDYF